MAFTSVPFGREGFDDVYSQISGSSATEERVLFGHVKNHKSIVVPALARIGASETGEPSIITVELSSTCQMAPVWRARLFLGELVLDHAKLGVRLEGELTEDDAHQLFDLDLGLKGFVGTESMRDEAFQRIASIALQLNEQQV